MKTSEEIKKLIEEKGIKVPELGIKIIPILLFNGKIYSEILKEVSEEFIVPYEILQKLRNIAFESGWEKYPFMKKFWVFVPNPDEVSKSNGYIAGFNADDDRVGMDCDGGPSNWNPDLGVFLYCPIEKKVA